MSDQNNQFLMFIEKLRIQFKQNQNLDDDSLRSLKEYTKNLGSKQDSQAQTLLHFFIDILKVPTQSVENQIQKTRYTILEIMSKGVIFQSEYDESIEYLFKIILIILQNDNEMNALNTSKILIELIKHYKNQIKFEENYIPLFQFLEKRTEFLANLKKILYDENLQKYHNYNFIHHERRKDDVQSSLQREKQFPLMQNQDSIKFLGEIPNIYIYTLNYVDTNNNIQIRDSLKNSISNIIKSIKDTPFAEFQQKLSKQLNNLIYTVMIKMVQFISIIMRKDISNEKYLRHVREQAEYIKAEEINQGVLNLLKNCPEDSQMQRLEIITGFKSLIKYIGKEKFKGNNEILDEETIFGQSKFQSIYVKNVIYNSWIEIISLIYHQDSDMSQFILQKIFDVLLKNLFDNNLYLQIQQISLKLLKTMIDNMNNSQNLDQYETRRMLFQKILHKIALKFSQIRSNFEEVIEFIKRKYKNNFPKLQQKTLFIQSLPKRQDFDEKNFDSWNKQRLEFIENQTLDLNSFLLTSSSNFLQTLNIMEDEEELILNCQIINKNTYQEYLKDTKDSIIVLLIEIIQKIQQFLMIRNIAIQPNSGLQPNASSQIQEEAQQVQNPSQSQPQSSIQYPGIPHINAQGQSIPATNQRSPINKLNKEDCQILGKILKNGLIIFEHFHNLKFHDDKEKNVFKLFMSNFAQIRDQNNFRDIIENNMDSMFKYMMKYSKDCFDICFQSFFIYPFYTPQNSSNNQSWKYLTEIFIKFLLKIIEKSPENLDPCDPYYEFRNEYHFLMQRLVKIPIKCLSKYYEDSYIRPVFKEFILVLIKKSHTSKNCLDYLNLMKMILKNLNINSSKYEKKFDFLIQELIQLCGKNFQKGSRANPALNQFSLIDNFLELYNSEIPEVKEVVTELIVLMPIRPMQWIQLIRNPIIPKIIVNSLKIYDHSLLGMALKNIEQIVISLDNHHELDEFLCGIRDQLVANLYKILRDHEKNSEIIQYVLKLLGKLGKISRIAKTKLEININKPIKNEFIIEMALKQNFGSDQTLQINLGEAILASYQLIKKSIRIQQQNLQYILFIINNLKLWHTENASKLLLNVFKKIYGMDFKNSNKTEEEWLNWLKENQNPDIEVLLANDQDINIYLEYQELIDNENILKYLFKGLMGILNINFNTIFLRQKIEIQEVFEKTALLAAVDFIQNSGKYSNQKLNKFQLYLKFVIEYMNVKVLTYGMEVNQSSNQLIKYMDKMVAIILDFHQKEPQLVSTSLVFKFLSQIFAHLSQLCYKKSLNCKHAYALAMFSLIQKVPAQFIQTFFIQILLQQFYLLNFLQESLHLETVDYCLYICDKLLEISSENIANDKQLLEEVLQICFTNIISHREKSHQMAKKILMKISKLTNTSITQLLFYSQPEVVWSEFKISDFQKPEYKTLFLSNLIKQIKIVFQQINAGFDSNLNEKQKSIQRILSPNNLKTIASCFLTLEFLISQQDLPFKIMNLIELNDDIVQNFDKDFKEFIDSSILLIKINERLYKQQSCIILSNSSNTQAFNQQDSSKQPQSSNSQMQDEERKDSGSSHSQQEQMSSERPVHIQQQYQINGNTFLDDEEFNLNIDDIDFYIQAWTRAISAAMLFMKSVLILPEVRAAIKKKLKEQNRQENNSLQDNEILTVRYNIIFHFFDLMSRVEKKIRKTANQCLKALIEKEQNPRDLISNDEKLRLILRPILICLQQDFRTYTPSFLFILRSLFKLLTQCFNKALSDKLMDHLNPNNNQLSSSKFRCVSGLLSLFEHLSYAYYIQNSLLQSLEQILKSTSQIEHMLYNQLGRYQTQQITRKNLTKFINKMVNTSSECIEFFFSSDNLKEYGKMFLEILKMPEAHILRERISRQIEFLMKQLFPIQSNEHSIHDQSLIGLQIIRILSKFNPRILLNNKNIMFKLQVLWDNNFEKWSSKPNSDDLLIYQTKNETVLIVKIFVQYCKMNQDEIKLLFTLLEIFNIRVSNNFSFLKNFYKYYLPKNYTSKQKRNILLHYLNFINNPQISLQMKVNSGFILIYPMLLYSFLKGEAHQIVDNVVFEKLTQLIQYLNKREPQQKNRLEVEILQLCSLFMIFMKEQFSELQIKISLIDFCWTIIKNEEKLIKNLGYIFVCKFIVNFGLSEDKILQIYVALLKNQEYMNQHDNDLKILSTKALDILIPFLPKMEQQTFAQSQNNQLTQGQGNSQMQIEEQKTRDPSWIKWTYKIFNEESSITANNFALGRFWQIFIKNNNIYYKYRKLFITQMINSMQYIFVSTNSNNFSNSNNLYKKIASDLSFIYIEWQYQEIRDNLKQLQSEEEKKQYLQSIKVEECPEICVNFFIRLAMNNCQEKEDKELIKRSLYLLKKLFIIWPDTKIHFDTIKKQCTNISKSEQQQGQQTQVVDKLKFHYTLISILNIVLEFEKQENIIQNIELIFSLLKFQNTPLCNCFSNDNIYLIKLLSDIIKKLVIIAHIKYPDHPNSFQFQQNLNGILNTGFDNYMIYWKQQQQTKDKSRNLEINPQLAFQCLYNLYEIDDKLIDPFLDKIKEATLTNIDLFKRRDLQRTLWGKQNEENEDILENLNQNFSDENFEYQKFNFNSLKEYLVVLLRMLAAKFGLFQKPKEILKIFLMGLEIVQDYNLKIEFIQILKCLLLKNNTPQKFHQKIKHANISGDIVIESLLDVNRITNFFYNFQKGLEKSFDDLTSKNATFYELKIIKIFNQFLQSIIQEYSSHIIDFKKLRQIMLNLFKYNSYDANVLFFNIIDQRTGNFLKGKFMFLFGEYQYDKETLIQERTEVFQFAIQYLNYYFNSISKLAIKIPYADSDESQSVECVSQDLEIFKCFNELFCSEFILKNQHTKSIWKNIFRFLWKISQKSDRYSYCQIMESYLLENQIPFFLANILVETLMDYQRFYEISPENLQYIAKRLNCWHKVIYMLEESILKTNKKEITDGKYQALHEILFRLREKDYMYGLRRLFLFNHNLRKMITFIQMREWLESYQCHVNYINSYQYQEEQNYYELIDRSIYEQSWTDILKNLNQWDTLRSVADECNNLELKVEAAMQNKDFDLLENCLKEFQGENSISYIANATIRMSKNQELFIGQQDSQHNPIQLGYKIAYYEFLALPQIISSCHTDVLERLQMLVELEESNYLMAKMKDNITMYIKTIDNPLELVHQHVKIWRERLPDRSEDLIIWQNILYQRNCLYKTISQKLLKIGNQFMGNGTDETKFKKQEPEFDLDMMWNNLKLFSMQRKYNYFNQISKLQEEDKNLTLELSFMKIKEIMFYIFKTKSNLDEFNAISSNFLQNESAQKEQKAEIFRIRGVVFNQKDKLEEAINDFEQSLSNVEYCYKPWIEWHLFCYNNFISAKQTNWLDQAIIALAGAMKYKPYKSFIHMSNLFFLLNFSQKKNNIIVKSEIMEVLIDSIPKWIWLFWSPHIFSLIMIKQSDTSNILKIIQNILIQNYPQEMFYIFNGYQLESNNLNNEYKHLQNCQKILKMNHTSLIKNMQKFYHQCCNMTQPRNFQLEEEKLLNEMWQLQNFYFKIGKNKDIQLFKNRINICLKHLIENHNLFSMLSPHLNNFALQQMKKIEEADCHQLYEILKCLINQLFENDFLKNKAPQNIKQYNDREMLLIHKFKEELFIPGQFHNKFREPIQEKMATISSVGQNYEILFRNNTLVRRIKFIANSGKEYYYIVDSSDSGNKPEQFHINQLNKHFIQIFNSFKLSDYECKRRNVKIDQLQTFQVLQDAKLIEDNPNLVVFSEIEQRFLKNSGYQFENLLKQINFQNACQRKELPNYWIKINREMKSFFPSNLLRQEMLQKFQNFDQYFSIRKKFTKSYSASMFLSYFLSQKIYLENMFFNASTGKFYLQNINHDSQQFQSILKSQNLASIRLTRNIKDYITEYGIEGIMASTFLSIVPKTNNSKFKNFLFLYSKDIMNQIIQNEKLNKQQQEQLGKPQDYAIQFFKKFEIFFKGPANEKEPSYEFVYYLLDQFIDEENQEKMHIKYKVWF